MRYVNEYDLADMARRFDPETCPVLATGVLILVRLANWTNRNSDGWAYWPKPVRAASRLMDLLESVDRWEPEKDLSVADLNRALTPIKAFATRQGFDYDVVLLGAEVVS